MWYRVFGKLAHEVPPVDLVVHLHALGIHVEPHFRGDDLGWTAGELRLPAGGTPVVLNRFLTVEDRLRPELNFFAADLETRDYSPNHVPLMQHVIQAQQLITLRKPIDSPDEVALETVLLETCRLIAARTDGVYQIDDVGWFTATGEMLLQEY
jgi:hypothetical protein